MTEPSPAGAGGEALRVLHGITEIAGQAALSAHGLRRIGVEARAWFEPHPFGYGLPPDYRPRLHGRIPRALERLAQVPRFAARYDVFHFHAAASFVTPGLGHADVRLLKRLGRGVWVEFWGSEIRLPAVERERNPFYVNAYSEDDAVNRARIERWAALTEGRAIVSDHSFDVFLRPYFSELRVVGQRVDTERLHPVYPRPDAARPVLVHAPSNTEGKGTRFVREAVERLRKLGLPFEYVEVTGLTQAQALEQYRRADLIVDQLCYGSHGVFACEAMALGKPVVCYVLPELVDTFPEGFPLINANPLTITAVLEAWLADGEARARLGRQSRTYAERVHDSRAVARRLVAAYTSGGEG